MAKRMTWKQALKNSGLKTKAVADRVGIKPDTLRRFVNGRTNMREPAQIVLAQVLQVQLEDMKAS